jgi:hypothetical protein
LIAERKENVQVKGVTDPANQVKDKLLEMFTGRIKSHGMNEEANSHSIANKK